MKTNTHQKVLVLGSAILDVIVSLEVLPASGEDVFAKQEKSIVGGCAYNVANILNHLQTDYDLMVPIGKGPIAKQIYEQLEHDGHTLLNTEGDSDNGWCLSIVEEGGERTFLTVPGIENEWQSDWFENIDVGAYDYIYVSGYAFEGPSADIVLEGLRQKKASAKVIFDPSPRASYLSRGQLEGLYRLNTTIHCNFSELVALTGIKDLYKGAAHLYQYTSEPVVITLGSEGTFYYDNDCHGFCEADKVTVVDTIGAGDAHTGGFIAGLAKQLTIEKACNLGNEMASNIVQVQGGRLTE